MEIVEKNHTTVDDVTILTEKPHIATCPRALETKERTNRVNAGSIIRRT